MTILKVSVDKLKGSVKDGVKKAQEGLSNIDIEAVGKTVESGLQQAKGGLAKIDASEVVQEAKDRAKSGVVGIAEAMRSAAKKPPAEEKDASPVEGFASILWYFASADGEVSAEERTRIHELARGMDEGYDGYAAELERECLARVEVASREFGLLSACKFEAQRIIEGVAPSPTEAKLICWNLLAVGAFDGLGEEELDFIRFASERMRVDAAVLEELRNYANSLIELGRSKDEFCCSSRSYAEIEPLVVEFDSRERIIIEAAQALVTDR